IQRKLNNELLIYKLCRAAMGFNDLCRERQFDLIAARERTKRIVIQLAQAREFNHGLCAIRRFCRYENLAGLVLVSLVLHRACTKPLESLRQLEKVEIAL